MKVSCKPSTQVASQPSSRLVQCSMLGFERSSLWECEHASSAGTELTWELGLCALSVAACHWFIVWNWDGQLLGNCQGSAKINSFIFLLAEPPLNLSLKVVFVSECRSQRSLARSTGSETPSVVGSVSDVTPAASLGSRGRKGAELLMSHLSPAVETSFFRW